jgi:hypothetical protein
MITVRGKQTTTAAPAGYPEQQWSLSCLEVIENGLTMYPQTTD